MTCRFEQVDQRRVAGALFKLSTSKSQLKEAMSQLATFYSTNDASFMAKRKDAFRRDQYD